MNIVATHVPAVRLRDSSTRHTVDEACNLSDPIGDSPAAVRLFHRSAQSAIHPKDEESRVSASELVRICECKDEVRMQNAMQWYLLADTLLESHISQPLSLHHLALSSVPCSSTFVLRHDGDFGYRAVLRAYLEGRDASDLVPPMEAQRVLADRYFRPELLLRLPPVERQASQEPSDPYRCASQHAATLVLVLSSHSC